MCQAKSLRSCLVLASILLLLAGPVPGWAASDCSQATAWQGTIGKAAVTMEFRTAGQQDTPVGRYYYRASLTDLFLEQEPNFVEAWKESDLAGAVTGRMTLVCDQKTLKGTWTSADGSRTAPIQATPAQDYSRARLETIHPRPRPAQSLGPNSFQVLTIPEIPSVTGLRLLGEGAGLARINQYALQQFVSQIQTHIDNQAAGRWERGLDNPYDHESQQSVLFWNPSLVTLRFNSSGYYGGAHPSHGESNLVFDLKTGQPEKMVTWLSSEYQEQIEKDSKLGQVLSKIYSEKYEEEGSGCLEEISFSTHNLWINERGLQFPTDSSYAAMPCNADVEAPFQAIQPFLSEAGKTRLQSAFPKP